jgi:hypothetical protein
MSGAGDQRGPDMAEPLVGAVYGYRWWRAEPGGRLRSPWHGHLSWGFYPAVARCLTKRNVLPGWTDRGSHGGAPVASCHCGFYGLWHPPTHGTGTPAPQAWELDPSASGGPDRLVLGVVEASGRVLLGTEGFRARVARPVALVIYPRADEPLEVAAARGRFHGPVYRDVNELVAGWDDLVDEGRRLTSTDA